VVLGASLLAIVFACLPPSWEWVQTKGGQYASGSAQLEATDAGSAVAGQADAGPDIAGPEAVGP
jgi:hypothetical protein